MFPERIYQGATVIIDGQARRRDGRPFNLSGYNVKLVLVDSAQNRRTVTGGILSAPQGKFQVTLSKTFTQELALGTAKYELFLESSNESYVADQGQIDVRPRL